MVGQKRKANGQQASEALEGVVSVARRKLLDSVMDGFVIGNTNARALFTPVEARQLASARPDGLRLLYLGVGDVRNALSTLDALAADTKAVLVLNDASPLVLARNALVLELACADTSHATAMWSDAVLSEGTLGALEGALDGLLAGKQAAWLSVHEASRPMLAAHWRVWRAECKEQRTSGGLRLLQARTARLAGAAAAGHGRAGCSRRWLERGVASVSCEAAYGFSMANPTLFDLTGEEPRLVEMQSPAGAFLQLEGLTCGGTAFAQTLAMCWNPLFVSLAQRVRAGVARVELVAGDCLTLLETGALGSDFDAVDTSNLIDYLGLWNVLLLAGARLAPHDQAFVLTEQIMGVSDSLEDMLEDLPPNDAGLSRALARLVGLTPETVPEQLLPGAAEKVVHARWRRQGPKPTDWELGKADQEAAEEEASGIETLLARDGKVLPPAFCAAMRRLWPQEIAQLKATLEEGDAAGASIRSLRKVASEFVRECAGASKGTSKSEARQSRCLSAVFKFAHMLLVPQPMPPRLLESVFNAVEARFNMPTSTAATFVRFLAAAAERKGSRDLVEGALGVFFEDPNMVDFPHVRLRTLAIRVQSKVYEARLGLLRPAAAAPPAHVALFGARVDPLHDLFAPKGGILEPALAVLLMEREADWDALKKLDTMWSKGGGTGDDDEPINLLFERLGKASAHNFQIMDNVAFDEASLAFSVLLPSSSDGLRPDAPFESACLIDVQQYRLLTRPVPLGALRPKAL